RLRGRPCNAAARGLKGRLSIRAAQQIFAKLAHRGTIAPLRRKEPDHIEGRGSYITETDRPGQDPECVQSSVLAVFVVLRQVSVVDIDRARRGHPIDGMSDGPVIVVPSQKVAAVVRVLLHIAAEEDVELRAPIHLRAPKVTVEYLLNDAGPIAAPISSRLVYEAGARC